VNRDLGVGKAVGVAELIVASARMGASPMAAQKAALHIDVLIGAL
jgi:hypothetical protein